MKDDSKRGPVPNDAVSPGFEAVYTGMKSSSRDERVEMVTTVTADEAGNELRKWPVFTWTMPGDEKNWDQEIKHINSMQRKLGPLDDRVRQIRAHIGSLAAAAFRLP